jgi:SAM-dependent methyltransferase
MKISNFENEQQKGDLDKLACRFRTDKGSFGHGYTRWYEPMFAPMRQVPLNILEIGVGNGASLNLWEAYFPNARITGLDINEKLLSLNRPRVEVRMLNSGIPLRWEQYLETPRSFDIIIDDGGHCLEDVLCALPRLWPTLTPGGYYIIEDLGCDKFPTTDPISTPAEAETAKALWRKGSYCDLMVDFHLANDSAALQILPSQNRRDNSNGTSGQCLVVFQKKR